MSFDWSIYHYYHLEIEMGAVVGLCSLKLMLLANEYMLNIELSERGVGVGQKLRRDPSPVGLEKYMLTN